MKKHLLTMLILAAISPSIGFGQTTLSAGDLMMVTVNADGSDNFDFVPLIDLESGTTINFTDNAWVEASSALNSNEGTIIYTAGSAVTKGTVVSFPGSTGGEWTSGGGTFNCSGSGDNILVYQGSSSSPTFIYGIGWASSTPWVYTGTTNSDIPSTLSSGANTLVTLGTADNYQYNTGTGTSGTESELLALIANSGNWNSDNSTAYSALSSTFTISSGTPTPIITVSTTALSSFNYESGSGPSNSQTFTVSGSDLSADISVAPSTNYELSEDNASFQSTSITLTESSGTVTETTIYVRLKSGLTDANYNEDISLSSAGATNRILSCSGTVYSVIPSNVIINEVDADTYGTDYDEFIELYDGGTGNTDLSGLVLVLYNGNGDVSYAAYDLDGQTTNANGFYVIGNSQVPNVDNPAFSSNEMQNGADAVALYQANATDFPNGTSVTLSNIIDAVVYGTDDPDDAGLLILLNDSEPQINENLLSAKDYHSMQRMPNGSGGQRNTSNYQMASPTPGENNFDDIWLGDLNNSWSEALNWNSQSVPGSSDKIYIPGDVPAFPELSSPATIQELVLAHDAQLNGQEYLTVNGATSINHQITKSTSNLNLDHWQYFASPFSGTTAGSLLSSNARVDLYIAEYDNSLSATLNNAWSFISNSLTPLASVKGYAVTFVYDDSETGNTISGTDYNMNFSGTLISASSNATYSLTQGLNNWNLIGNPYLTSINWSNSYFDFSNIQGSTAYVYNPSTGTYTELDGTNTDQYISAMQGFFVEATSAGSFGIDLDARVNTAQSFFKSSAIVNQITIIVTKDSLTNQTAIFLDEMSKNTFDTEDAHKLLTNSNTPQIYTTSIDGELLVFNHMNTLDVGIPLRVQTKQAGNYTISLREITGVFNDYHIELTDHNGIITELDRNDYQFDAEDGLTTHEFTIHCQNATSIDQSEFNKPLVYSIDHSIIVKSYSYFRGTVNIYNLSGLRLYHSSIEGSNTTIELYSSSKVVIVQLIDQNKISYFKVNIN